MNQPRIKKKSRLELFDVVNYFIMFCVLLIVAYPLYFTVIASISDPAATSTGQVTLWPVGLNLDAYEHVFAYKQIWVGYGNSLINTVLGTLFNLLLTIPAAYALSKRDLPHRGIITVYFLITMYFSGGLIPTYLQIKKMNLLDTRTILILLGGLSVYNLIVSRTYFSNSIDDALYEAAEIDGADEFKKFFTIALPLSKPIIAVMALYYSVSHWNGYFNAMIYTNQSRLETLQLVLRRILVLNQSALDPEILAEQMATNPDALSMLLEQANMAYTMKFAVVFIASAPLLVAYPFVQKYFVKGVMIGAVKG